MMAAGLCVALQVGAWRAPLVHAHLDDQHHDHHAAAAVHAHFGGHPRGPADAGHATSEYVASGFSRTIDRPILGSDDDSEQTTRLQAFVAVAGAVFATPALPPAPFALPVPIESATRRLPDLVRSHGPPGVDRPAPRAPPTASVLI